ncbi:hypothetical protein YC2023_109006 [Brassica napus]
MEAIKHIFSLGIRFRMRFKGEESPERMVRFQELEIYLHNCQLLNGDHCKSNGMSQQQSRDPAESCHLPLFQRLLNHHNQSARGQDQSNHPEKQLKNTYGVPSWQEPITPSAANEP